jgi:hypothetical protein
MLLQKTIRLLQLLSGLTVDRSQDRFCSSSRGIWKEKGRDYVNLGYKAGGSVLLMALNNSFRKQFSD